MTILTAIALCVFNLVCIGLTLLQMPGLWLMLLAALMTKLWRPEMFSWTTLGVAAGITVAAEVAEFAAGAVGAKSAGATRRGMWGAVVGGVAGAVIGTFVIPVPIVGTLIGAALGSGLAAAGLELTRAGTSMDRAARVAGGAAVGRFSAALLKLGFAAALAVVLGVGAWVD